MILKSFHYYFVFFLFSFFFTISLTQADTKDSVDLIFTITPLKTAQIKPSGKSYCQEDEEDKVEAGPIVTDANSTLKPEDIVKNVLHWVNYFTEKLLSLYTAATGGEINIDMALRVRVSFSGKDEKGSYTYDEEGGHLTLGYFPRRVAQGTPSHTALHAPEIAYHVAQHVLQVARPTGEKSSNEEKVIKGFLARYLSLQLMFSLFQTKDFANSFGSNTPSEDELSHFLEGTTPVAYYKTGPFYVLLSDIWKDRYSFTSRNVTIWKKRFNDIPHLGKILLSAFEEAEQLNWVSYISTLFWHFQSDPTLTPKTTALLNAFRAQNVPSALLKEAVQDLASGQIDKARNTAVHNQRLLTGPRLAQVLYDKKHYNLALDVKTRKGDDALKGTNRAEALYQKGFALEKAGDLEGAARALTEALSIKGIDKITTCLCENQLGLVLYKQEKPAEALPHLLRAFTHIDRLERDGPNCLKHELIFQNIALAYRADGKHQMALVFWLKQERAFPGWQFFASDRYGTIAYPAEFVLDTAEYFHRAGQFEDAIKRYKTLVNLKKLEMSMLDYNIYPLDASNLERAKANLEKARKGELIN